MGDEGRVLRKIQVGGLSGRPCVMISMLWRMSLKGISKGSGHGHPMMTSLFSIPDSLGWPALYPLVLIAHLVRGTMYSHHS